MRCYSVTLIVVCTMALLSACGEERDDGVSPCEQDYALCQEENARINEDRAAVKQRNAALEQRNAALEEENARLTYGNTTLRQQKTSAEARLSQCRALPRRLAVVKGIITVRAGECHHYTFSVTPFMDNADLTGSFRALSGGPLYVYLFDESNFQNWKGGGNFTILYNSGKVVVGDIDMPMTEGEYYVVFSNKHSWITSKIVNADISLYYISNVL